MSRFTYFFLMVGILLSTGSASAQDDEGIEDEFALLEEALAVDEVESASKHRQSIFWSPSTITVFTREDVLASGAVTLADLLRRVPGFDVYDVKRSNPLVGARGLTDESNQRVLVLVDGREDMIELTGFPLWIALGFGLEEIERIEVIRGPGSTLYGANAFSAVVNITTISKQQRNRTDIHLGAGENGQFRLFGRYNDKLHVGKGSLYFGAGLGVQGEHSPSDREDQSFAIQRAHAHVGYRAAQSLDISLHAGVVSGEGLVYIHMGDIRVADALNYWFMSKATLELGENIELSTRLYYTRYMTDLVYRSSFRARGLWIADLPDFYYDAQAVDGQAQLSWQIADRLRLLGGGYTHYAFMNTENVLVNDTDELRGAVFLHLEYRPLDVLQLTGGFRADLNTDTRAAFSPRAVVVFRPYENQAFRLGYGLAFRKPSHFESRVHIRVEDTAFPEIRAVMEEQLGNEDLVNEQVHSIEAGWRGSFLDDELETSIDLFFNMYRDTITFVVDLPFRMGLPDIQNSTVQFENSGDELNVLGGEARLAWNPLPELSLWCNVGLRRVINRDSSDELYGELHGEPLIRLNFGGRYLPASGWVLDLAFHYVSSYRMPLMDPGNILENQSSMELGNNLLLIGRLGYGIEVFGGGRIETGFIVWSPVGAPFRQ